MTSLPIIAQVTGGSALVAREDGTVIRFVNSRGTGVAENELAVVNLASQAGREKRPLLGTVEGHLRASAWALPVGSYVLAASNSDQAGWESRVRLSLEEALPLIAQVVGGEAVLFDGDGKRLKVILPDGSSNPSVLGKISESCLSAIQSGQVVISPSTWVPGAMAVRIPFTRSLGFGFNNALSIRKEQRLLEEIKRRPPARYSWDDIIGQSRVMRDTLSLARRVAKSQSPVWIFGETGTGKELFAQAIHTSSSRAERPFIALNCAALPSNLVESQLFGYVEGAFTGAKKGGQPGLFEASSYGTLLLDEISEMDRGLQAKLLRVLQEQEICRIGSSKSIPVDVRVICTSNRDLREMVVENKFREDLFYRLNVMDIRIPPLRERREDISLLVQHFLATCSLKAGKLVCRVDPAAMELMMSFDWPGNVRELQNCVERAVNLVEGDTIGVSNLPSYLVGHRLGAPKEGRASSERSWRDPDILTSAVRKVERDVILEVLEECGGNRAKAASRLGISVTTLWRRLR